MMSLKSFHLFFVGAAIVLLAGFGTWGLIGHHLWLGMLALAAGVLLVWYDGYFARKTRGLED